MTDKQNTQTQRHDYPDTYNQSNSLDACTCDSLYCCKAIANRFNPTTHKVSLQTSKAIILPKTKAFCYSHHLSQYTLCETN